MSVIKKTIKNKKIRILIKINNLINNRVKNRLN